MSTPAKSFPWWTTAAFVLAVLGNVIAAVIPISTLLQMPPGSSRRLMADAFFTFVVAAVTFVVVATVAVIGFCKERRLVIVVIALSFSLTPFFFSGWVMRTVAEMRHIVLEP